MTKSNFRKVLDFFQLSDREGNISLTNLSLIIVITKIAITPFDWTGAAILLPVIASYMHKRVELNKMATKEEQDLTPLLEEIENLKANQEEMNKVATDTQKLVSQANLAQAFTPRGR